MTPSFKNIIAAAALHALSPALRAEDPTSQSPSKGSPLEVLLARHQMPPLRSLDGPSIQMGEVSITPAQYNKQPFREMRVSADTFVLDRFAGDVWRMAVATDFKGGSVLLDMYGTSGIPEAGKLSARLADGSGTLQFCQGRFDQAHFDLTLSSQERIFLDASRSSFLFGLKRKNGSLECSSAGKIEVHVHPDPSLGFDLALHGRSFSGNFAFRRPHVSFQLGFSRGEIGGTYLCVAAQADW